MSAYLLLAVIVPIGLIIYSIQDPQDESPLLMAVCSCISFLSLWSLIKHLAYGFPKIEITEQGIKKYNLFGWGASEEYSWQELNGYDTDYHFTNLFVGEANEVKIFKNHRCVIRFDAARHSNYEQLKEEVQKYLNWYPAVIKSKRPIFFILFMVALLLFCTLLAVGLVYYVFLQESPNKLHLAMRLFLWAITIISCLGAIGGWIVLLRGVFPAIEIMEQGIQKRNFFGLGIKKYYTWQELSGYDTDSVFGSHGSSLKRTKVFKNKHCVLSFDQSRHTNYKKLQETLERYLSRV